MSRRQAAGTNPRRVCRTVTKLRQRVQLTESFLKPTRMTESALIIGATGAVGRHLLKELLASPDVVRVGEYGRR